MSKFWELKNKESSKPVGLLQSQLRDGNVHEGMSCDIPTGGLVDRGLQCEDSCSAFSTLPCSVLDNYDSFFVNWKSFLTGNSATTSPITILRDTGAAQTLMLGHILPELYQMPSTKHVLVKGFGSDDYVSIPLRKVSFECALVTGNVPVGVVSQIPIEGIDLLLGNDLAGSKVVDVPHLSSVPTNNDSDLEIRFPGVCPSCVMTRSQRIINKSDEVDIFDTFLAKESSDTNMSDNTNTVNNAVLNEPVTTVRLDKRNQLISDQLADPSINQLFDNAVTKQESTDVPVCYYTKLGLLMRRLQLQMNGRSLIKLFFLSATDKLS
jgi:hypothetical protein